MAAWDFQLSSAPFPPVSICSPAGRQNASPTSGESVLCIVLGGTFISCSGSPWNVIFAAKGGTLDVLARIQNWLFSLCHVAVFAVSHADTACHMCHCEPCYVLCNERLSTKRCLKRCLHSGDDHGKSSWCRFFNVKSCLSCQKILTAGVWQTTRAIA